MPGTGSLSTQHFTGCLLYKFGMRRGHTGTWEVMWDSVSIVCVHESMSVDTHDAGVSVVFTSVQVNVCGISDTGSGHAVGMNAHLTLEHLTP